MAEGFWENFEDRLWVDGFATVVMEDCCEGVESGGHDFRLFVAKYGKELFHDWA